MPATNGVPLRRNSKFPSQRYTQDDLEGGGNYYSNSGRESDYNSKKPKAQKSSPLLPLLIVGGCLCLIVGTWTFGGFGSRTEAEDSAADFDSQIEQNEARVFSGGGVKFGGHSKGYPYEAEDVHYEDHAKPREDRNRASVRNSPRQGNPNTRYDPNTADNKMDTGNADTVRAKIEAEKQARQAKEAQKRAEQAAKDAENEAARVKAEAERKLAEMKAQREEENRRRQAEIEEAENRARREAERQAREESMRAQQELVKKEQEDEALKRQQRATNSQPAGRAEQERPATDRTSPDFGKIPIPTAHQCQEAAQRGQCLSNALFMASYCPKYCDAIHQQLDDCTDYDEKVCAKWAKGQECERSAIYMSLNCARSCYSWLLENKYQSAQAYGQTHGCTSDVMDKVSTESHHGEAQHLKGVAEDKPEEEMKAGEAAQHEAEAGARLTKERMEKEMLANEINQIKAQAEPAKADEDVDVRKLEEDIEAHERAVAALRAKQEQKKERKTFTGGQVRSYGSHQKEASVMDYGSAEDDEDENENEVIEDNIREEANKDINDASCKRAAEKGQCQANALFMAANCPHSCQAVREDSNNCTDVNLEQCLAWAAQGECEKSALYLSLNCPETCWKTLTEKNHMYAKNYGTTHGCT